MEYEFPPLPDAKTLSRGEEDGLIKLGYTAEQMRQYAEQAVAPLLAEIERLKILAKEEYESGYEAGQESMRQRLS